VSSSRAPRSNDPASDPEAWAALRRKSRRVSAVVALVLGVIVAVVLSSQRTGLLVAVLGGAIVAGATYAVGAWLIERTMHAEDDPPHD